MEKSLWLWGVNLGTPHSIVTVLVAAIAIAFFAFLVLYGIFYWIQRCRDCYGQPILEMEGIVIEKQYEPPHPGPTYGPNLSMPSFILYVLLENQAVEFRVDEDQYNRLEKDQRVLVTGRRGKHSQRFYPRTLYGPIWAGWTPASRSVD